MRIALVVAPFRNHDIDFNVTQLKKNMDKAKRNGASLVLFGEAFLQGFDCLSWDYRKDCTVAIAKDDKIMQRILAYADALVIDLGFGYFERQGEAIFSSYALYIEHKLHCYRRISHGWKEYRITDDHYQEGSEVLSFVYQGKSMIVALCGDMWSTLTSFEGKSDVLIWPIYVNYTHAVWQEQISDYAKITQCVAQNALIINSLSKEPRSIGGAFHIKNGKVVAKLPFSKNGILYVDL